MDSVLLTWILATAVLLSLGFSTAALIIQIKRSRRQKKASADNSSNHKQSAPYFAPPQQNYYSQQPQSVPHPQVAPDHYDDENEKTQSLFSSRRDPVQETNIPPGSPVVSKSYNIHISETGPAGVRTYQLNIDGSLTVGRASTSGLYIDDSTVSGLQCMLLANPGGLFIENKSGSNITQLNGVALTGSHLLRVNDTIKIGKVQLLILNIYETY